MSRFVVYDLLIRGGHLHTPQGLCAADIAIRAGKIAALLEPGASLPAREQVDVTGAWVLPGVIDTHVHLRDPGGPEREDFATGTAAAAAGGVTTLLEMPISNPPVNAGDVLEARVQALQARSRVDVALYGGAGMENPHQLLDQARAGAVAFKTFLHAPPPSRQSEFRGLWCTDEGELRSLMQRVLETGLRHCFHCENNAMVEHLAAALRRAGRNDPLAHAECRPESAEVASVAVVLALAEELNARVHIVHLSSPKAASLIHQAKARGVDVTAETCPHYLFLTDKALLEHGALAKCNPPLRSAETVAQLWRYVQDGTIDVIGSDHAPFTEQEKAQEIWGAPSGFPGLELMLPLMLTAVSKGDLRPTDLPRLLAQRAAEVFQLPGKGQLQVGNDADLAVVDPAARWRFDHRNAHSKSRGTMRLFDGIPLVGRVELTLVRGKIVYAHGQVIGEPSYGQFVRPGMADPGAPMHRASPRAN